MKTLKTLFFITLIVTLTGCAMVNLRPIEKDATIIRDDQVLLDNLGEISKELSRIESEK